MLINVAEREECRVAVIDKGSLEELYTERSSLGGHVGNIYKGKVSNILQNIQSAFIDIGEGENGFIHLSDILENTRKLEEMFEIDSWNFYMHVDPVKERI